MVPESFVPRAFRHHPKILLYAGCSHLVLSLLPARLAAVIELFGYKGDRDLGLKLLMRPGGWGEGEEVVSAG